MAGLPGDLRDQRPVYDDRPERRLQAVHGYAKALGKQAFARRTGLKRTVAGRAALGEPISSRNVAKALRALRVADDSTPRCPVDGHPVFRSGAVYCSPKCGATTRKRRQREKATKGQQGDASRD